MYLIAFMYFFFKRNNSYTWERFMGAFKKVVYSPPIIKIKKIKICIIMYFIYVNKFNSLVTFI